MYSNNWTAINGVHVFFHLKQVREFQHVKICISNHSLPGECVCIFNSLAGIRVGFAELSYMFVEGAGSTSLSVTYDKEPQGFSVSVDVTSSSGTATGRWNVNQLYIRTPLSYIH